MSVKPTLMDRFMKATNLIIIETGRVVSTTLTVAFTLANGNRIRCQDMAHFIIHQEKSLTRF